MEHLLRLSGLLTEGDDADDTDLGTLEQRLAQATANNRTPPPSAPSATARHSKALSVESTQREQQVPSPASAQKDSPLALDEPEKTETKTEKSDKYPPDLETLQEMMDSLVTNNHGETRFIGSSSGFSIFSPRGIQWVREKSGDDSFQQMILKLSADDNQWHHWKPEVFGDIFARRNFSSLPPKEETLSLLTLFFETFNRVFPLFHENTFIFLAEKQYTHEPYDGVGWWASLNVALAIACRMRELRNIDNREMEAKGWAYFKNALACQAELELRSTDLLSVQALLGMAVYLTGTPNPQPSFILLASAIRLAQSIGLHKRTFSFGLNPVELEQRKRVFWIAYMMDKDISLRSGRPPTQHDDDWNTDLPSESPDDGLGDVPLADGSGKINMFRKMCEFALIQSRVYKRLYSVKASKQPDGELLNTIGDLDAELEAWKDSIPLDYRPEHEIKARSENLMVQIVVLHFSYYNCVTTVHRMSIHHGYWSSRLSNYAIQGLNVRPLNPRVFSSAALCVQAARASINLLRYIPHGDCHFVWLIIYFPVSSLLALFANILQNPLEVRARSDLKLIAVVVDFLARVNAEDSTGSIRHMFILSQEFQRIAGVVLEKAERELTVRQKRKQTRERDRLEKSQRLERQPYQPDKMTAHELHQAQQPGGGHLSTNTQGPDVGNQLSPTTPNSAVFGQQNMFSPQTDDSPMFEMKMQEPAPDGDQAPWFSSDGFSLGPAPMTGSVRADPTYDMAAGNSGAELSNVGPNAINTASFQHPFLPQDFWNMPMTFEWDFAQMTNHSHYHDPMRRDMIDPNHPLDPPPLQQPPY